MKNRKYIKGVEGLKNLKTGNKTKLYTSSNKKY